MPGRAKLAPPPFVDQAKGEGTALEEARISDLGGHLTARRVKARREGTGASLEARLRSLAWLGAQQSGAERLFSLCCS